MKAFAALKSSDYESLSETVQDFFHFVESSRKLHRLKDLACVGMLKDPIQKLQNSTLDLFNYSFLTMFLTLTKRVKCKNKTNLRKFSKYIP